MSKKLPTLGDLPPEEQSLLWENDRHVLPPPTPEREAQMEKDMFVRFKKEGLKPEQLYKHDPEARARYREFLRTHDD